MRGVAPIEETGGELQQVGSSGPELFLCITQSAHRVTSTIVLSASTNTDQDMDVSGGDGGEIIPCGQSSLLPGNPPAKMRGVAALLKHIAIPLPSVRHTWIVAVCFHLVKNEVPVILWVYSLF